MTLAENLTKTFIIIIINIHDTTHQLDNDNDKPKLSKYKYKYRDNDDDNPELNKYKYNDNDNDDDNPELNKYKWVHPHGPLGLIYPTNAAILHREEKID